MWFWIFVVLCGGYFLGCLHGARIAQIISGVNLKQEGVKNFGASNATIVLGKKFGALVAAIDIGKGVIAIILARTIAVQSSLSDENSALIIFLAGAAVVVRSYFSFLYEF